MSKKKVAVIFGGQSSEHDISCISGTNIIKSIDREAYDVIMIGITKQGEWLLVDDIAKIEDGSWREGKTSAIILPDRRHQGILIMESIDVNGGEEYGIANADHCRVEPVDVVFPVLHGLYGEDGTIQGLCEMSGIPYVGCGVLASAAGMDKLSTKKIVSFLHIRQADFVQVLINSTYDFEKTSDEVEAKLGYPVFVKPSNAGSSVGVTKAENRTELKRSLEIAAAQDNRILIEEAISGREIECAVFGDGDKDQASGVGEILAAADADFYDFDAKYNNSNSQTVIGPDISEEVVEEIRKDAVDIFKALDGFGLSRVDFFVENGTDEVVFNEINTLPGFTAISMYPMLWEACGVDKRSLITQLIEMAPKRKA